MTPPSDLRVWSHDPLPADVQAALKRVSALDDVLVTAAMPDVHLARGVCIGAVVATATRLFPSAVGGDIGCGMCAVQVDGEADRLRNPRAAAMMLRFLGDRVPTASHPSRGAVLPSDLADQPLSAGSLERKKKSIGRTQFATLGRGNHFVEFQADDDGALWLMIHTGSRGIGQAIRDHHLGQATGPSDLESIDAESDHGQHYLADLNWALDYARQSRRRLTEIVAEGLNQVLAVAPTWNTYLECHHNFVRRECHDGTEMWVHRKGAISARDREPGIIPGSMGSASYHVQGRGNPASLCSSSHGAGRIMSRTEARRAISTAALLQQMNGILFDHRLSNRLRDEAPAAYKDISTVMRAQKNLTRIVRRLQPVLVYKGA